MDHKQGGNDEEDDHADFPEGVGEFKVIRVGRGVVCGSSDPNGNGGHESETDEVPV